MTSGSPILDIALQQHDWHQKQLMYESEQRKKLGKYKGSK